VPGIPSAALRTALRTSVPQIIHHHRAKRQAPGRWAALTYGCGFQAGQIRAGSKQWTYAGFKALAEAGTAWAEIARKRIGVAVGNGSVRRAAGDGIEGNTGRRGAPGPQ
jgi:hypothetical protein